VVQDLCINVLLTLLIWIPGAAAAELLHARTIHLLWCDRTAQQCTAGSGGNCCCLGPAQLVPVREAAAVAGSHSAGNTADDERPCKASQQRGVAVAQLCLSSIPQRLLTDAAWCATSRRHHSRLLHHHEALTWHLDIQQQQQPGEQLLAICTMRQPCTASTRASIHGHYSWLRLQQHLPKMA
jgi:hypothetical protein